jgi:hypothetical protein
MIINNPEENSMIEIIFHFVFLLPPMVMIFAASENGARTLRFRIIENPITNINMMN